MNDKQKLSALYAKTVQKKEATLEMAQARAKHTELVYLETQYRKMLALESADVEKLDKASLENLYYRITGKMEEKRLKETSEAEKARERYDAVSTEIKAVTDKIGYLKYELRTLGNCDLDFEALRKEMVDSLTASDGPSTPHAVHLLQQMNQARADADELTEVIETGKAARKTATDLLEELRKAQRLAHNYGRKGGSHGVIADEVLRHMESQDYRRTGQEILDRLKRQLDRYHTTLYPLPPFGHLTTIENILCGRTGGGTEPIDSGVAEIETLLDTLEKSTAMLERIREGKLEAQKRLDRELTEALLSTESLDRKEQHS